MSQCSTVVRLSHDLEFRRHIDHKHTLIFQKWSLVERSHSSCPCQLTDQFLLCVDVEQTCTKWVQLTVVSRVAVSGGQRRGGIS